jgi:hypothetical protein
MATKEELLQAAQDAKDQPKIDAAYSAALTSTEEKPAPPPLPKPAPMPKPKKMASGGSASSRADGCALRGKTRA